MALIFAGSTDLLSSQRTSRIIGPLLRFFDPNVTDETIRLVQMVIRKGGHLTEYAILAMLARRAFSNRRGIPNASQLSTTKTSWQAWWLSTLYAGTDEIHQAFVSSRQGSPWDVLIDSIGACLGLCAMNWHARWRSGRRGVDLDQRRR